MRQEVEQLKRMVKRLQEVIAQARAVCEGIMSKAQVMLSARSGVPRGAWSFCKGAYNAAAQIHAYLEGQ